VSSSSSVSVISINMSLGRQISFVPLSIPSPPLTGLYFSVNGVAFHGLFDSGSDGVVIPTFVARDIKMDLTYRKNGVVHRFGETFTTYRAPFSIIIHHSQSDSFQSSLSIFDVGSNLSYLSP